MLAPKYNIIIIAAPRAGKEYTIIIILILAG